MIEDLNTKEELLRFVVESLEGEPLPMSAVSGLQSTIEPGKWNALTLAAGFSNYGGGYSPAAWRSIPGGGIQMRGLVQKATATPLNTIISTLPKGLAPKERLIFDGMGALGLEAQRALRLDIDATGNLLYFDVEATIAFLSLSDVIFWPGS